MWFGVPVQHKGFKAIWILHSFLYVKFGGNIVVPIKKRGEGKRPELRKIQLASSCVLSSDDECSAADTDGGSPSQGGSALTYCKLSRTN